MTEFKTILIEIAGPVSTIWLNRPEVHNAFNEQMISELSEAINTLALDNKVRILVLRGKGKSFSSGADINSMKKAGTLTGNENFEEALRLAELFESVYNYPNPLITVAHGTIAGGANGLIASSDFCVADKDCVFRFSEVRLGLVPATISPYVVKKIGISRATELMLTARPFSATEAEKYDLVNRISDASDIDSTVDEIIKLILQAGPGAVRETKTLLRALPDMGNGNSLNRVTAGIIAKARASNEAAEGLDAFLNKRKPSWHPNKPYSNEAF